MVVAREELELDGGKGGSINMKRMVASLVLVFVLGLFLSYASFAENWIPVYYTQEEPAWETSFYSYAIVTEKTVQVFGFYVGPISTNDKRMNLVFSEEGTLQFQEAGYARSYENEPFCAPMLFVPEKSIQEASAPGEERVVPGETISFFRADNEVVIFPSTFPNLDYKNLVLATVPKAHLAERREEVYATKPPEEIEDLEKLLYQNNLYCKDPSSYYGLEKPKSNIWPDIWAIKWDKISADPGQSPMFFKNQIVRDLKNLFKWGNFMDKFPGKPFTITVSLSIFGSNGQVDYEPILEISGFEISDLNIIPNQVDKEFDVSNAVR